MRSPEDMNIIQIDITNACYKTCSNCIKFSGHHKDPFYMDWTTFRRACESFCHTEYKGMIGIIGGEPTLHPDFEKYMKYFDHAILPGYNRLAWDGPDVNEPIDDIFAYQNSTWNYRPKRKRGLWTSLGPGYAKNFEIIRKVFDFQSIRDHRKKALHQINTITRKELKIPDDKWEELRDNCWLQNQWSASITPKGAFFCEVAGTLDMLFDGPGGWPIEKGWWERKPCDFKDQLHWCELCGICLKTPYVQAHVDTDIVSPVWDSKLKEIGSTKKRVVLDIDKCSFSGTDDITSQIQSTNQLLCQENIDLVKSITLNKIVMVTVCIGYSNYLRTCIVYNKEELDGVVVVTEESDIDTINLCKEFNLVCHISNKKKLNDAYFNKGALLNDGIAVAKEKFNVSWILVSDSDIILPFGFKRTWSSKVLNPGTLYYAARIYVKREEAAKYVFKLGRTTEKDIVEHTNNKFAWGYFQLFNLNAEALRHREKPFSEEFLSAGYFDADFAYLWPENRRYYTGIHVLHLEHGGSYANWNGMGT